MFASRPLLPQQQARRKRRPLTMPLQLEYLEGRWLLSMSVLPLPLPLYGVGPGGGWTPAQIRHAYGFDDVAFDNGAGPYGAASGYSAAPGWYALTSPDGAEGISAAAGGNVAAVAVDGSIEDYTPGVGWQTLTSAGFALD